MVAELFACPHCSQTEPVIKHGFNRGGSQKLLCKACRKVFTPRPNTERAVTAEKENRIEAALSERLSQRAIARMLGVSRDTIRDVLKKKHTRSL